MNSKEHSFYLISQRYVYCEWAYNTNKKATGIKTKWIKVALSIGVHYLYVIRWRSRYFVGSEKAALKLLKELGAVIIVTIKDDGTNAACINAQARARTPVKMRDISTKVIFVLTAFPYLQHYMQSHLMRQKRARYLVCSFETKSKSHLVFPLLFMSKCKWTFKSIWNKIKHFWWACLWFVLVSSLFVNQTLERTTSESNIKMQRLEKALI